VSSKQAGMSLCSGIHNISVNRAIVRDLYLDCTGLCYKKECSKLPCHILVEIYQYTSTRTTCCAQVII